MCLCLSLGVVGAPRRFERSVFSIGRLRDVRCVLSRLVGTGVGLSVFSPGMGALRGGLRPWGWKLDDAGGGAKEGSDSRASWPSS